MTVGLTQHVELSIGGMTCASCAARIERKLNRMPGVHATVNYATEKASVDLPAGTTVDDAIATVEATGYTAQAPPPPDAEPEARSWTSDDVSSHRRRLVVSAMLSLPVLLMAMIPALQFDNWQWLSLTLAAPVAVWGAWPFHRAAAITARHGATTMDTLISVGVLAAFGWSLYALFFGAAGEAGMRMPFELLPDRGSGGEQIYLEIASVVTVFLLAGRFFEARAKRRSGDALRTLLELGAKDVAVRRSGREQRVPIGELAVGDEFVVRPGEKLATDGVVVDGTSAIDTSLLTGESMPVEVGPGSDVTGATVNAGGWLLVRATRVGSDTALAQLGRLVAAAQSGKAPVQRLADRISAVFVPVVIALALATLAFWLLSGADAEDAFSAAVAVLIVACPCALGLATPTALLVGTGRGAQLGIVIKGPQILESTRRVDTVVLDKTGTVTSGRMRLTDVVVAAGEDADVVLRLGGAVEEASEHPVGRAIADAARRRFGHLPPVQSFSSAPGLGVVGVVEDVAVMAGRPEWLAQEWAAPVPTELAAAADAAIDAGQTMVAVGWDGAVRGLLLVADTIQPTSREAVAQLRGLGLRPLLLTGDNERAARSVATEVAIDDVVAGVLPAGKVDVVRSLQKQGRVVAMVGDGVNDAAALAQADLGISLGSGTDIAIDASDLTLMRSDLRAVTDAIRLSRRTLRTIKTNLFWAFAYNVAAIPLAMAGLLNPLVAGAAMALSSVFVVSNSLRLRSFSSSSR